MAHHWQLGLLVSRGLAPLAQRELALYGVTARPAATVLLKNHELLLFAWRDLPGDVLFRLRTVEDLFLVPFSGVPLHRRRDLATLNRYWTPELFHSGLQLANRLRDESPGRARTFAVFVKADRDRAVQRREIAEALAAVPESVGRWRPADPAAVEFWGFFADCQLTLGLRLTRNPFRFRPELVRDRAAALRPTLAAALAVASAPAADDVVLDPMCGTGTVLYERAQLLGYQRMLGVDCDAEAVKRAQTNLGRLAHVEVRLGDATALDLPDHGVDVVLCNLPFGTTYSDRAHNPDLYRRLGLSLRRVLKPKARVVVLSSDEASLRAGFAPSAGFVLREQTAVLVLGLWAQLVSYEVT